ncbi:MAG TPA: metalloregulator ArsR/SmtB family transcription factor [bacterium]|jgi:ArsR family transcriptional regulator|nr:metalloregulator ArsR/SmtB family transcription factor [bacterium]HOV97760.1 metalloregulator ArsR/SmtB family transcription factor [bacterium]HQG58450.1 metalloregulator ArsR/SmtB family transcription factor [bacterium]HQG79041.1 metalloregulator ArsR/SmtB family transcription factor [bacterium]HQK41707.1 metalloregulator ArsR/SmtB family transcription factor [bacterium]
MRLEKLSKALSDKNRLQILEFLSDGQRNVSDVADRLNVEENLASHHLRVLASLGFLKNDKKGREVYYMLNETKIVSLLKDLSRNPKFRSILEESLRD